MSQDLSQSEVTTMTVPRGVGDREAWADGFRAGRSGLWLPSTEQSAEQPLARYRMALELIASGLVKYGADCQQMAEIALSGERR